MLRGAGRLPWAATHAALPAVGNVGSAGFDLYFSPRDEHNRAHVARAAVSVESGAPREVRLDPTPVLSPGPAGRHRATRTRSQWTRT